MLELYARAKNELSAPSQKPSADNNRCVIFILFFISDYQSINSPSPSNVPLIALPLSSTVSMVNR